MNRIVSVVLKSLLYLTIVACALICVGALILQISQGEPVKFALYSWCVNTAIFSGATLAVLYIESHLREILEISRKQVER